MVGLLDGKQGEAARSTLDLESTPLALDIGFKTGGNTSWRAGSWINDDVEVRPLGGQGDRGP